MQLMCTGPARQTWQVTINEEPLVLPHSLHALCCAPERQEIKAVSARVISPTHQPVMGNHCRGLDNFCTMWLVIWHQPCPLGCACSTDN